MLKLKSAIVKFVVVFIFVMSPATSQTDYWQATNGPGTDPITFLIITKDGTVLAGGTGLYRSTDQGNTWKTVIGGVAPQYINGIAQHPNGNIFALCYSSEAGKESIIMSTDDGNHWAEIQTGYDLSAQSIAINPSGTILVGGDDTHFYRSTDDGSTWTSLPQDIIFYGSIFTIVFDSSNVAYAGSVWGVCYSTNYGTSWSVLGSSRLPYYITSLAVTKTDDIIAGTYDNNGVYKLNGFSSPWNPIGLTGKTIFALITNERGDVFCGRPKGQVLKYQGDTNWVSLGAGIPNTYVWSLAVDPSGYLYAGTDLGTVYRSITSTTIVANSPATSTRHFSLEQNYPNPFNPSTNFSFHIASQSFVSLKVFNLLGTEVITIISEEMRAGDYSRQWNASNLPSGVYFYRLQSGLLTETKKLLLLK